MKVSGVVGAVPKEARAFVERLSHSGVSWLAASELGVLGGKKWCIGNALRNEQSWTERGKVEGREVGGPGLGCSASRGVAGRAGSPRGRVLINVLPGVRVGRNAR